MGALSIALLIVEKINRRSLEPVRASISRLLCLCVCFFCNSGFPEYNFQFELETKSHLQRGCGDNRSARKSPVEADHSRRHHRPRTLRERQWVRHHRSKGARIALPEQQARKASLYVEVTRSEREPHDTCQAAGKTIDPVNSATRERWYVKYHQPRAPVGKVPLVEERCEGERYQSNSRGRLACSRGKTEGLHNFSLQDSWGENRWGRTSIVERQCVGNTDRRSAGIAREPGPFWR